MKTVLFIFGTRPELIKLNPLIKKYKSDPTYKTIVCITSQHKELLHDLFQLFDFTYDYDLSIMDENQTLVGSFNKIVTRLNELHFETKPSLIFVQGDTTSAFAGSLFGYYNAIKVVHIEAGLRSGDINSPYPEEGNRKMIATIASYHFCPTTMAYQNLINENYQGNMYIVGNTVIDSLAYMVSKVNAEKVKYNRFFTDNQISQTSKKILITAHRRENYGEHLNQICDSISQLSDSFQDVEFIVLLHPNKNGEFIKSALANIKNVKLLKPVAYDYLVFLLLESSILMTDSGGIQEEAIYCNKPILVLRENTERQEVIEVGAGILTYNKKDIIVEQVTKLLLNSDSYNQMINKKNPYGDGKSSEYIFNILDEMHFKSN